MKLKMTGNTFVEIFNFELGDAERNYLIAKHMLK